MGRDCGLRHGGRRKGRPAPRPAVPCLGADPPRDRSSDARHRKPRSRAHVGPRGLAANGSDLLGHSRDDRGHRVGSHRHGNRGRESDRQHRHDGADRVDHGQRHVLWLTGHSAAGHDQLAVRSCDGRRCNRGQPGRIRFDTAPGAVLHLTARRPPDWWAQFRLQHQCAERQSHPARPIDRGRPARRRVPADQPIPAERFDDRLHAAHERRPRLLDDRRRPLQLRRRADAGLAWDRTDALSPAGFHWNGPLTRESIWVTPAACGGALLGRATRCAEHAGPAAVSPFHHPKRRRRPLDVAKPSGAAGSRTATW